MSSDDADSLEPEQPPVAVVAGKYELVGLIGRGGMGSVWEGRHKSLGTRVAIKFIDAEYANSQDARNRFDNEARAAATIQSKHAIQVFDHGMLDDGRPYIVMELLQGEPLDARLKRMTRISLQETVRILQHVCRALGRAHERGIIHRDLKPENVFLVRNHDDDDEIAKVLDFGIAKIRTTPGAIGVSSSTKTGTLLGTPFYMSPEQARGLRNVDHRSDLWSLGVIVFRCVTGVLPFDGESLGDLLVKICTVPVPVPSHVMPGLPASFDAWMARALDREPEKRFQTAQELSDALAYACGVSVRRPPSSGTPEPGVYSGRQSSLRAPVTDAMTPSQARAAGLPASGAFSQPIPPATSAPLTASTSPGIPTSSSRGVILSAVGAALVGLAVGVVLIFRIYGKPAPAGSGLASGNVGGAAQGATSASALVAASVSAPATNEPPASASVLAAVPEPPPTTGSTAIVRPRGKTTTKPATKPSTGAAAGGGGTTPATTTQKPALGADNPGY